VGGKRGGGWRSGYAIKLMEKLRKGKNAGKKKAQLGEIIPSRKGLPLEKRIKFLGNHLRVEHLLRPPFFPAKKKETVRSFKRTERRDVPV